MATKTAWLLAVSYTLQIPLLKHTGRVRTSGPAPLSAGNVRSYGTGHQMVKVILSTQVE